MFKKFWKEMLLAAALTTALFLTAELAGNLLIPIGDDVSLSAGLMIFSIAVLVIPALIGCIPSGFLIAKKSKDIKAVLFVPAIGAAIGGLALMVLSTGSLLLMTDAAWQDQMAEAAKYGGEIFAKMSLEEYKSIITLSVAFGAVFLGILNFAIGMIGGFAGSKIPENTKPRKKTSRPKA